IADRPVSRRIGHGDRRARGVCGHPVVISALLTALGAVVWVTVFARVGTDLSAAMARAGWASRYPGAAYLFSWYGGFPPAGSSLLAPYLLALIGVRQAMAAAAVISAVLLSSLLVRHRVPGPGLLRSGWPSRSGRSCRPAAPRSPWVLPLGWAAWWRPTSAARAPSAGSPPRPPWPC